MENQEKQNISEPHVQVFGEEIKSKHKNHEDCHCGDFKNDSRHGYSCKCHHHHSSGIIWGLGIIFAGTLLLLINAGIVSGEIWVFIAPFWPVLLILIGFRIILGHSWLAHFLVSLMALAAFCFVALYGLIMVNSPLVGYWHLPSELINFISQFK